MERQEELCSEMREGMCRSAGMSLLLFGTLG
jgi:hypothetical protein